MKKPLEEKISPVKCVKSLQNYNEKVVALTAICKVILDMKAVDKEIAPSLQQALNDVTEFHQQ